MYSTSTAKHAHQPKTLCWTFFIEIRRRGTILALNKQASFTQCILPDYAVINQATPTRKMVDIQGGCISLRDRVAVRR